MMKVKQHIDMGPRKVASPYVEIREGSPSGKYSSAWWCDPLQGGRFTKEFADWRCELAYIHYMQS